jgi:hypothetical protein
LVASNLIKINIVGSPHLGAGAAGALGAALGAGALGVGLGFAAAWKGQKPYGI